MWDPHRRYDTSLGMVAGQVTGSGPPLVLAHGWPWSSRAWHRVLPELARDFTLYLYDMPGFGRSDKALDRGTGLDAQGEVFCEMLDLWGLERPSVLAHDFGGAVALRAHLLHGRPLDALVLMNVVALSPWGSEFFDHVGQHVAAFEGLPPHIHAAVVEAYIRGALAHPIPEPDLRALIAPWLGDEGQAAFYRQFALADEALTDAFADRLGQQDCRVSVLWGRDDPWIPLSRGETLAWRLGNVPFTPLPGLGHLPQLEDPAAVVAAMRHALVPSEVT
jgi:pimeloyl-ACP methyl ester carboxylesterase